MGARRLSIRRLRRRVRRYVGGRSILGVALVLGGLLVAATTLASAGVLDRGGAPVTAAVDAAPLDVRGQQIATVGAPVDGAAVEVPASEQVAPTGAATPAVAPAVPVPDAGGQAGAPPTAPSFNPVVYQGGTAKTTLTVSGGNVSGVAVEAQQTGGGGPGSNYSVKVVRGGTQVACLSSYDTMVGVADFAATPGTSETWTFTTHTGNACGGGVSGPTETLQISYAGPASGA